MKTLLASILLAASFTLYLAPASAADGEDARPSAEERKDAREARRADFEAMSPDKRKSARSERRKRFEGMSDEDKAAAREHRGARGDKAGRKGRAMGQGGRKAGGRKAGGRPARGDRPRRR